MLNLLRRILPRFRPPTLVRNSLQVLMESGGPVVPTKSGWQFPPALLQRANRSIIRVEQLRLPVSRPSPFLVLGKTCRFVYPLVSPGMTLRSLALSIFSRTTRFGLTVCGLLLPICISVEDIVRTIVCTPQSSAIPSMLPIPESSVIIWPRRLAPPTLTARSITV